MSRRILLSTIHASDNYGSVLQATCLATALGQFGDVHVLDHRPPRVNIGYAQDWLPYQVLRRRRNPDFRSFVGKHRRMTQAQRRLPLTRRAWRGGPSSFEGYDTAVVGSDEVWSGLWGDVPAYFLAGAPESTRRVAYAVSAGRGSTMGRSSKVPEWLAAFDAIHPRDENTADLCRTVGVDPGEVVCDPVMLVEPDVLVGMARPDWPAASKPYTLIYAEQCRFDERVDGILRAVDGPSDLLSIGFPYPGARSVIDAGLPEFVAAVAGADLVVTSMFHGLVTGLSLGKTVALMQHPAKAKKVNDLIRRVNAVDVAEGTGFRVVAPSPEVATFRASSQAALATAMG